MSHFYMRKCKLFFLNFVASNLNFPSFIFLLETIKTFNRPALWGKISALPLNARLPAVATILTFAFSFNNVSYTTF